MAKDQIKISIRFFDDREVRAVWDDEQAKWWFCVLDIVGVLNEVQDYSKVRNYWKYLKAKLKKENHQLVSTTTQLKLTATDDKSILLIGWKGRVYFNSANVSQTTGLNE